MTVSIHVLDETARTHSVPSRGPAAPDLLERLKDPQTSAAMHQLLDGVTALHVSGGLATLFEGLGVIQAFRMAATDTLIDNLTQSLENVLSLMSDNGIVAMVRTADHALAEAAQYAASPKAPTSLWELLRALSRPEAIRGLILMLGFSEEFQRRNAANRKVSEGQG
jgi:uncharacterized protein YjgD (DUF1641 family)